MVDGTRQYSTYSLIPQEPPETEVPQSEGSDRVNRHRLTCWERWNTGHFTIVPENNWLLDIWDVLIIAALLTTALVLPVEVALIPEPPPGLYLLGKAIDVIFVIDIVLNFFLAYEVTNIDSSETYQQSPLMIAKHYMAVPFSQNLTAGWFWPDVVTVFPWEVVTSNKEVSTMRLVRVLRLVRMLRLVRVLKLFKRWHTHFGFSFALVRLHRCMGLTLLLTHWLACLWAHLGLYGNEYAHMDIDKDTWLSQTRLASAKDVHDFTWWEAYLSALYFCTVVLTTVGFGDIVPLNQIEVITMIATIFITGVTWTWVVGNIVDIIGNLDIYALHFNQAMDDLNTLMFSHGVSQALKRRIRRHLHEAYNVHRQRHHKDVIRWLSDGLQGKLAVEAGVQDTLNCIWYFKGSLTDEWMIDLAQHFVADMFSPGEFIKTKTAVSVIRKGAAVRKGRVLVRDAVIGEDMILVTEDLKDSSCPRTLGIVEVMSLSRADLLTVAEKHDQLNLRLRRAQVKLALWRGFILLANKIRRNRQNASSSNWDSYFDGTRSLDLQAAQDFWAALGKGRRPGWVENAACGRRALPVPLRAPREDEVVHSMSMATDKSADKSADKNADLLLELHSIRRVIDDQESRHVARIDHLAACLETLAKRLEPNIAANPSSASERKPLSVGGMMRRKS